MAPGTVLRPCPRCEGVGTVALRLPDLTDLDRGLMRSMLAITRIDPERPIYSSDLNGVHGPSVARYRALVRLTALGLVGREAVGTAIRSQRPPRYRYWLTPDGLALVTAKGGLHAGT